MAFRTPKLLFLIVDGVRARFVRQEPGAERFSTIREIEGQAPDKRPKVEPAAWPSPNPEDGFNRKTDPFAAEVADLAASLSPDGEDGVALVAPGRMVPALRRHLHGRLQVAAVLPRDLTRTPDEELGQWLGPLAARAAERQLALG